MAIWIKVCGVRDVDTARAVADSGANAVGLNFYRPSPRHVNEGVAAEIVAALPAGVTAVGVFVNHSAEEIRRVCHACGISTVQLHGDEPASLLSELQGLQIIRALRTSGDLRRLADGELSQCQLRGVAPWAWLVDARVPHLYGGSGESVDWEEVAAARRDNWPPLILAGGLTPENIVRATQTVKPWGVDVASGVESSPGVKDPVLVARFISRIREAS